MTKRIEINLLNEPGPTVTIDGKLVRCIVDVTYKREGAPLVVEALTLRVQP